MSVEEFIQTTLRQAATYIKKHYPPTTIETKSPRELVTEVDRDVERLIRKNIQETYPEHGIRGEELADHQPEAEYQWIIDPVDGTTNYAHNIPVFCSAIALLQKNHVIAAGVINPVTGDLWQANQEKATKNARPIKTPQQALKQGLVGYCHANDQEGIQTISRTYQELKEHTRDYRRLGSANLELCMVASGELAGFIGYRIQPWDFLPGCLIAAQAGAIVTGWDDEEWQNPKTRSVLVATKENHAQIKKLIQANT